MRHSLRGLISTGHRRFTGAAGGGGNGVVAEPVVEVVTIPALHGAATYPITSVNGFSTGNLSEMVIEAINVEFTGVLTAPRLGVQVSTDGGSTWVTTGTVYRRSALIINDSEGFTNGNDAYCHDNPATATLSALITIKGLNAAAPMAIESIEMSPVQANATQKHWANFVTQIVPANAVRIGIFADTGTPILTGGTLRILGMN